MERKTQNQLDDIAIKVINLLADNDVCIVDVDCLFERVNSIIRLETKIKKIDT